MPRGQRRDFKDRRPIGELLHELADEAAYKERYGSETQELKLQVAEFLSRSVGDIVHEAVGYIELSIEFETPTADILLEMLSRVDLRYYGSKQIKEWLARLKALEEKIERSDRTEWLKAAVANFSRYLEETGNGEREYGKGGSNEGFISL